MGSLAASLIQAASRQHCNLFSDRLPEYLFVRMIPISLYSLLGIAQRHPPTAISVFPCVVVHSATSIRTNGFPDADLTVLA